MSFRNLLALAVKNNASDLHLTAGAPPVMRIYGKLVFTEMNVLSPNDTETFANEALTDKQKQLLEEKGHVDLSLSLYNIGRFRVNIFKQRESIGIAARLIPYNIPTLDELSLPPIIGSLASKKNGFILVTGPAGSGKSTTLASMVDMINTERSCHIITLEDPIEFLHKHKKVSLIKGKYTRFR